MESVFENELKHHGILGMKWGVRRYQNLDGTLTPLGKIRYGYRNGRMSKRGEQKYIQDKSKMERNLIGRLGKSNKNYYKALDEYKRELKNTPEAKAYNDLVFRGENGLPLPKGNLSKIPDAYFEVRTELEKKHRSDVYSAILKDLREDDTEAGRKFVEKVFMGHLE